MATFALPNDGLLRYGDFHARLAAGLDDSLARVPVKHVGNVAGFGVTGDAILDIWVVWP